MLLLTENTLQKFTLFCNRRSRLVKNDLDGRVVVSNYSLQGHCIFEERRP